LVECGELGQSPSELLEVIKSKHVFWSLQQWGDFFMVTLEFERSFWRSGAWQRALQNNDF
jgi:hypothetical protein